MSSTGNQTDITMYLRRTAEENQNSKNSIYPIMETGLEHNFDNNQGENFQEWDDTGIYDQIIKKQNSRVKNIEPISPKKLTTLDPII
jgi:hypothetical protein